MDWLTFIVIIFITFCIMVCVIGYTNTRYDNEKLQEENNKLKEKLKKRGKSSEKGL